MTLSASMLNETLSRAESSLLDALGKRVDALVGVFETTLTRNLDELLDFALAECDADERDTRFHLELQRKRRALGDAWQRIGDELRATGGHEIVTALSVARVDLVLEIRNIPRSD